MPPVTTNEFTVKNYFNFAEEVVSYDDKLSMVSLAVESLFTNNSLEETIKNGVKDFFPNDSYCGKLTRKDLYMLYSN